MGGSTAVLGTSRENVRKVTFFGKKLKNKNRVKKVNLGNFDTKKWYGLLSIFFCSKSSKLD